MKKILQCLLLSLLLLTILPNNVLAEGENAYAYSEANGNKKYYYSINDAMNATRENLTVVMTRDWVISSPIEIVEGTTSKIEMNGHSISRNDYSSQSSDGHVFLMHPNSKLYLYGNNESNHSFNITGPNGNSEVLNGGLVYGGNASDGGGVYMKKGSELHLENVSIANNKANEGGGVYIDGANCYIYMTNKARIEANSADYGAGIYSDSDNTHIHIDTYSSINDNKCSGDNMHGGGVYFNKSWFTIESTDKTGMISNNTSKRGGGICVAKRFWGTNSGLIKGLTIDNNYATSFYDNGGGLYLDQNNTTVENCLISNNGTYGNGGGIYSNGKNTIINSTIIDNKCNLGPVVNNNKEGGGIYCEWGYDVTLSGKVTIKNNYRMNPNYIAWWNHYNKKEYVDGYFGYSDDNAFLSTSSVYLVADNLDSSSLIGIRTGESNDKKCVKNVSDYKFGQTFFMDLAYEFHIGYETNDKEVWQRIDTSASTKYTLSVNGVEVGRYTYDQDVTAYGASKDAIFFYWTSDNYVLSDEQKFAKTLTFKMPAYDVDLTANYKYEGAEDATLTVDAPVVGINLNTVGKLSWTVDGVGYTSDIPVTWYEKLSDNTYKQTSGAAKANTAYIVKTSVEKDGDQNMIFDNVKKEQVKVIYKTTKNEAVDHANNVNVDAKGTLSFEGFEINSVSGTINVSYSDGGVKVEVGSSETDLKAILPSELKAYSELNSNIPYTVYLDVENANISKVKLDKVGTYPVTIPVKKVDGLDFSTDTITCYVRVSNKQATLSSLEQAQTEVTVNVGDSADTLIAALKNANFNGNAIAKEDISGNEIKCEVGLRYLSNDKLIENFKNNGLLSEDGKVVTQKDGKYEFTRDVYIKSVNYISVGDVKAKFVIRVVDQTNANSLEEGIAAASVEDEISLASNEEDIETYNEAYEVTEVNDEPYTFAEEDYITIPKVTSNLEDKTYTVSDINDDSVTYDKESGNLSLNVKLSVENIDNQTPTIKYIKYYQNNDGEWVKDEDNSLTLSVSKGETKKYVIEAWSELEGQASAVDYFTYTIDNTKRTITVVTKYIDGTEVEKPKVLTYNYNQEDVQVNVPLIKDNRIYYWSYSGEKAGTYGVDECLVKIDELDNNETLTVVYYPAITSFSLDVNSLTAGESLPTISKVSASLSTNEKVDVTDYFDLSSIEWISNSKSETIDYDTVYIAKIQIKDNITTKYALSNDALTDDENVPYTNGIYTENGKTYVAFIFNATNKKDADKDISYNLSSLEVLQVENIDYENALTAGNDVDAYDIPTKLSAILHNNNTNEDEETELDVIWDKCFTKGFEPDNVNSQQLKIKGKLQLPSYIANPDGLDTNITLTFNVVAKKVDKVELVNKEDVLNKIVLSDYEKELLSDDKTSIDIELEVSNVVSDKDITLVNDNLGNYKLGQTLDLSLTKIITYKGKQYSDNLTSTTSPIEVSITITDALVNKTQGINRTYKVLRLHDNKVDVLDASFNESNNTLTFKTDKFSTYAIVYVDTIKSNNNNNKVVTCEEYMNSKDWTWSESKKACVYRVANTSVE